MSSRTGSWLAGIGVALAAAYAFRRTLVRLLTRTTGTWVGSPHD